MICNNPRRIILIFTCLHCSAHLPPSLVWPEFCHPCHKLHQVLLCVYSGLYQYSLDLFLFASRLCNPHEVIADHSMALASNTLCNLYEPHVSHIFPNPSIHCEHSAMWLAFYSRVCLPNPSTFLHLPPQYEIFHFPQTIISDI